MVVLYKGLQVLLDLLDLQGQQAQKELQETQVLLDLQVAQGQLDQQVLKDKKVK